ncbi:MATE family efflux transporter [Ohessyouella blattaphilus]|uniref:Probable multidrug resistance protein NorM n=1 Tax=Ohessyouella blattaphilus TaxID=2949333 RepID=A0ABT1EI63_9FIRM|nr:MATE family efflux transporter [Ohessyouella blattaphilus]MCP1110390.1 MATE family efflux transporter [Ohessyouella blattaphilus]MCR8563784.1 MATE family efflux transporter [Ohessyouella blattaphilus]
MRYNAKTGRNELILLWSLAMPTVIEQLLMTIVQYVDTAMVGRLGAQASAAVGVTSTMVWLSNAPLYAMGVGVLANIARASGQKDQDWVNKSAAQGVLLVGIVGFLEGLFMCAISYVIPRLLGAESAIRAEASRYFLIVSLPMIFRSAIIVLGAGLRAVKEVKKPMWINIGTNVLNIILNFFLIYQTRKVVIGKAILVLPGMGLGVTGAAIATAISFVFGGVMMALIYWRNPLLGLREKSPRFDKKAMYSCVKIAIPVGLERVFVSLGHVIFTGFVTSLGTVCLAAHTIALTAEQAFYIPGYGMQAAVSTMIGNGLGERDEKRVRRIGRLSFYCALFIMTVGGVILFFGAPVLMGIFTSDNQVVELGSRVLRLVALSEPAFAIVIMSEGIFNGAGYTKIPFMISVFSMWGVRLLLSFIGVFVLKAGLEVVWLCMIADTLCRCLGSIVVYRRGRWLGSLN